MSIYTRKLKKKPFREILFILCMYNLTAELVVGLPKLKLWPSPSEHLGHF